MTDKEFGAVLRHLRARQGWTQEELAARAGVDQTSISQFERGLVRPKMERVARLAHAFDMRAEELARQLGYFPPEESPDGAAPATRTITVIGRAGETTYDLDKVIAHVEGRPDPQHQRRLARWRRTLQRADYERILVKIFDAWGSNSDMVLSSLETVLGPDDTAK